VENYVINRKNVIAIIPARGGSKGLVDKNIVSFLGKPLICWSVELALENKYIDTIIVSTDSERIRAIAQKSGAHAPFLRPPSLSSDSATTVEVAMHALDYCLKERSEIYDYVVLLEPTSPLRKNRDIDLMLEKIENLSSEYDAIISLGAVKLHPALMKRVVSLEVQPFYRDPANTSRRQDLEDLYFPFGVAYIIKSEVLMKEETFYPTRTTHHIIDSNQCFEIDDYCDLIAAEAVMKQNLGLD
jgi:CMP-N,N'-diacetyllegionaminic acid synthase